MSNSSASRKETVTGPVQKKTAATSRRSFLATSTAAGLGAIVAGPSVGLADPGIGMGDSRAGEEVVIGSTLQEAGTAEFKGKIFKSVKWGMIRVDGASVKEKFELQKSLGYDGMELNSPTDLDAAEVRAASEATGMPVHGVVDMKHWKIRLSSPDEKVRAEGTEILKQAIRDSKSFGGDSVLLVPGTVNEKAGESHDDVWKRSIVEIRKVLPLASRLGVRVLIENVWNGFCEQADQMKDYLDEINSPWVGLYFDIGNVRRFAKSEDWIRTLGSRIVKLDVKDWTKKKNPESGKQIGFGAKIGDGDVDWPEVRKALAEIGFTGWCTAEVGGGNKEWLEEVATRMDKTLGLG